MGGYTAYTPPLSGTETYVGIGHVRVPYVWAGAATGMLAARLFDVAPDGTELLLEPASCACPSTAITGGSSGATASVST